MTKQQATEIDRTNNAIMRALYMRTHASHSELSKDLARDAEDTANHMLEV